MPCVYTLLYIYIRAGRRLVADWLPLFFRCRGCCCSCRAVVGGRVCGSCRGGCQLSAIGRASCRGRCCPHVGRLVAFLVALRCVGWLSVGRGAAVIMWGGSRLSCRILSGCRLLLMVSPDGGRVSRSSCRDRLPLLFVVSWSGVPVALRSVAVALRGAFVLTY